LRRFGWLARAAGPAGAATLFGAALARLDAVILSLITGSRVAVGLYGAGYRIFEATMFFSWALALAVLPRLSRLERRSAGLRRLFELACTAAAAVTVPLGCVLVLFGPTIVTTVYGSSFAGGGTALRILGGATALYGVFAIAAMTVAGQDRERQMLWVAIGAVVVNVALNLILIPPFGLNGAAVAMTAAQAVATVWTFAVVLRETGSVSFVRMFGAVSAGAAAMVAPALLIGSAAIALPTSLVAFAAIALAGIWLLHRQDLMLVVRAARPA
jgi:O-antigen/teichoic acid export membrane protein